MESDLYKFQHLNFLTIFEYYNKTEEKAENYYLFFKKYKECTRQYFLNIKKIYSDFSSLLIEDTSNNFEENNEDDEDFEEDKNIFELDLNNINNINIKNINNNIVSIKNDINQNFIELDLSPIYKVTNIIFKQFKNQINSLKSFLKGIDASIDSFHNLLEQIKKESNSLKGKYLEIKQNFFESISSYQKDNKELLSNYTKIENQIAQFIFLKNNEYIYKNNRNALNLDIKILENDLNIKIIELKKKEKVFMKKDFEKNNYCNNFFQESEKSIIGIKNNTLLIFENLKANAQEFLSCFNSSYHLNFKDFPLYLKEIQIMKNKSEYEDIINKNVKKINDDLFLEFNEKYKPIYYEVNILKNKIINQKFFDKLINNGYEVKPEMYELNDNEIYFIIKKMYNFSLVKKGNYDIDIGNKKNFISKIVELMFNFKKQQNIIQENNQKISEEQLKKLYKYIENNKDCISSFLEKLGNKRAEAVLQLPIYLFNIITKIFLIISDYLLNERDINILIQILILSQTFYKLENDEKLYICHNICKHELYQKQELWDYYIKNSILIEIQKRELNEKNIGRELDEDDIKKRNNDLVFAQLLTMSECMRNFDKKDEEIINLITPIFETYEINKENRDSILDYIKQKQ